VTTTSADIIRGTADLLILKLLDHEPLHGWGIGQEIQQRSRDSLRIQPGALYAALHRLARQGWIRSQWRTTENGQRAKYYSLTKAGKLQLESETETWKRLSHGVSLILATR
jgi:PadR family transcriptional regulator PadR